VIDGGELNEVRHGDPVHSLPAPTVQGLGGALEREAAEPGDWFG